MMPKAKIHWRSVDPLHRSWCYQLGEIKGRMNRLRCVEQDVAPTARICAIYLHTTLDQEFQTLVVDDPEMFTYQFVAGFLIGFGVFASEPMTQEVPF